MSSEGGYRPGLAGSNGVSYRENGEMYPFQGVTLTDAGYPVTDIRVVYTAGAGAITTGDTTGWLKYESPSDVQLYKNEVGGVDAEVIMRNIKAPGGQMSTYTGWRYPSQKAIPATVPLFSGGTQSLADTECVGTAIAEDGDQGVLYAYYATTTGSAAPSYLLRSNLTDGGAWSVIALPGSSEGKPYLGAIAPLNSGALVTRIVGTDTHFTYARDNDNAQDQVIELSSVATASLPQMQCKLSGASEIQVYVYDSATGEVFKKHFNDADASPTVVSPTNPTIATGLQASSMIFNEDLTYLLLMKSDMASMVALHVDSSDAEWKDADTTITCSGLEGTFLGWVCDNNTHDKARNFVYTYTTSGVYKVSLDDALGGTATWTKIASWNGEVGTNPFVDCSVREANASSVFCRTQLTGSTYGYRLIELVEGAETASVRAVPLMDHTVSEMYKLDLSSWKSNVTFIGSDNLSVALAGATTNFPRVGYLVHGTEPLKINTADVETGDDDYPALLGVEITNAMPYESIEFTGDTVKTSDADGWSLADNKYTRTTAKGDLSEDAAMIHGGGKYTIGVTTGVSALDADKDVLGVSQVYNDDNIITFTTSDGIFRTDLTSGVSMIMNSSKLDNILALTNDLVVGKNGDTLKVVFESSVAKDLPGDLAGAIAGEMSASVTGVNQVIFVNNTSGKIYNYIYDPQSPTGVEIGDVAHATTNCLLDDGAVIFCQSDMSNYVTKSVTPIRDVAPSSNALTGFQGTSMGLITAIGDTIYGFSSTHIMKLNAGRTAWEQVAAWTPPTGVTGVASTSDAFMFSTSGGVYHVTTTGTVTAQEVYGDGASMVNGINGVAIASGTKYGLYQPGGTVTKERTITYNPDMPDPDDPGKSGSSSSMGALSYTGIALLVVGVILAVSFGALFAVGSKAISDALAIGLIVTGTVAAIAGGALLGVEMSSNDDDGGGKDPTATPLRPELPAEIIGWYGNAGITPAQRSRDGPPGANVYFGFYGFANAEKQLENSGQPVDGMINFFVAGGAGGTQENPDDPGKDPGYFSPKSCKTYTRDFFRKIKALGWNGFLLDAEVGGPSVEAPTVPLAEKDFDDLFTRAREGGMDFVAVTTSHTAPYGFPPIQNAGTDGQPSTGGWTYAWCNNKEVDFFSPQMYGDGLTYDGDISNPAIDVRNIENSGMRLVASIPRPADYTTFQDSTDWHGTGTGYILWYGWPGLE